MAVTKPVVRPLLPDEISALIWVPEFSRSGKFTVKRNRFGAPRGLAHVPYAVESRLDRIGNPINVILTRMVDLKAEVYAAKRQRRSHAACAAAA